MSINSFMSKKFDHHGRAGRLEFLGFLVVGLLSIIVYISPVLYPIVDTFMLFSDDLELASDMMEMELLGQFADPSPAFLVGMIIWIFFWSIFFTGFSVMQIMTTVRRIRDMGMTPWSILWMAVPIVNLLFVLVLIFWPGKRDQAEANA